MAIVQAVLSTARISTGGCAWSFSTGKDSSAKEKTCPTPELDSLCAILSGVLVVLISNGVGPQ